MKKFSFTQYLFFSFTLLFISNLYAVEPPQIVDQPDDRRIQKEESKVSIPEQKNLSTSAYEDSIQVDRVQFQGGTVFELGLLADKVKPIIGKRVGKTEIVETLRSITEMYEQAGYVLSFAFLPKQDGNQGQLIIGLVEGYVIRSEIIIEDDDVKRHVERFVEKIKNEKPLTKATFERYVALIERTSGYAFKINVPKPKTFNGATTIRVEEVKSKNYDLTAGFDTSKGEESSLLISGTVQSLTSYADRLTASMLVPNDEIDSYYNLNYQQELGSEGLTLDFDATQFKSQGDDRIFISMIPIDYEESKKRENYSVGLKYPISLGTNDSWWLGARLHHLNEKNHYGLRRSDGLGASENIDKNLRYSALELNSQWINKTLQTLTVVTVKAKQGIEIGDNKNEFIDANGVRPGLESTHFSLMDLNATWRYLISPQWRLQTSANLFWSDDILPSAEQVRYGGRRFGRGYADDQAQGDRGYAAGAELRYMQPIPNSFLKRIEPYVSLDTAKSELRSNDDVDFKLSSVAIGADFTDAKYFNVGLEYAKPLGDAHFDSGDRSPIYNLRVRWDIQ